ncbi:hypothetical protein FCM35_KLT07338 [Carex littledalei]|uniref:Uncharacterized protein n=1 Tax=Carex littledalei TaxID=544730 RepID=A0A833QIK6_9POAL|nr:hypothetical protein FCM35_KLT07338 [Carex littledalei]
MPSSCSRIATLSRSRSDSGSVVRFQNGPLLEQHVSRLAHPTPCCCGLCSLHCCCPTAPRGLKFFFANHSQAHFLVNFLNLCADNKLTDIHLGDCVPQATLVTWSGLVELIHLNHLGLNCPMPISSCPFRRMKTLETLDVRGTISELLNFLWKIDILRHFLAHPEFRESSYDKRNMRRWALHNYNYLGQSGIKVWCILFVYALFATRIV